MPQALATAEIRWAGALRGAHGPVAIVDIGSNSVRLVIYESFSRSPAVVHNEKAICAIGRGMVTTGELDQGGIDLALEALARFRMLADAHKVVAREAVATAAARDAGNGREFIRRAESAWGGTIRVLSGEEEAQLAAEGVLAGTPDADGLAADLGGGSLDVVTMKNGRTGAAATFPFGPLRLMDQSRDDPDKARKLVDKGLEDFSRLGDLKGRSLYAVGGVWRSFARIDMERIHYPLHVLHDYTIPRTRALDLCDLLARQSKKSLDMMRVVSRRRAEALPYGAVVLERLLLNTGMKDVVISAYGLREGLLHAQLPDEERAKDPLIEFADATNKRISREPAHADEMFPWMEGLFAGETKEEERARRAVCLFSDMGWRRHPDDRALGAFNQVLTAPFAGASHRARALIATAIFHRYSGDEDFPREIGAHDLLSAEDDLRARRIGLAARLAFALSASTKGELPHYKLRMTPTRVLVEVSRRRGAIAGEPVQKRLGALASCFERKGEILIG
ncbi:MAG TPA: Ppx/GppA family phosphatase [Rhizomicrobium sp.]|jgi:exopolyphosphatase/guanosine-5'-triphosphate,3'-diphosphate pyrophosphatase|nr:Ppx/GppA family phosphatase [Rhizomicrobium sp.]